MSDELNNNQENKKKTTKNKEFVVKEQYQFKDENAELITDIPSESSIKKTVGSELIVDMPSTPVIKKDDTKKSKSPIEVKTLESKIIKIEKKSMKSNKELYESFIKELKNYSLSINDDVIYNSSIDKSKQYSIIFENDYFILYGKKYSYNGLKIKKIN